MLLRGVLEQLAGMGEFRKQTRHLPWSRHRQGRFGAVCGGDEGIQQAPQTLIASVEFERELAGRHGWHQTFQSPLV